MSVSHGGCCGLLIIRRESKLIACDLAVRHANRELLFGLMVYGERDLEKEDLL
jgi:hypothetical protein